MVTFRWVRKKSRIADATNHTMRSLFERVKNGEDPSIVLGVKMMEEDDPFPTNDYPDAASENAQMALDARDDTDNPNDCGTDVGWERAEQLANNEELSREEVGKMSAFARHRKNSDMENGREDCGWMMWKAWGGDEGVDWAGRMMDKQEDSTDPEYCRNTNLDDMGFTQRASCKSQGFEYDNDGEPQGKS